jgi:hypothetical protein
MSPPNLVRFATAQAPGVTFLFIYVDGLVGTHESTTQITQDAADLFLRPRILIERGGAVSGFGNDAAGGGRRRAAYSELQHPSFLTDQGVMSGGRPRSPVEQRRARRCCWYRRQHLGRQVDSTPSCGGWMPWPSGTWLVCSWVPCHSRDAH